MLHPSYTDLMKVVNSEVEEGETPVVNSRYSIVLATSKRARQIVAGAEPLIDGPETKKALSYAIDELLNGYIKIVASDEPEESVRPVLPVADSVMLLDDEGDETEEDSSASDEEESDYGEEEEKSGMYLSDEFVEKIEKGMDDPEEF